MTDPTPSRPLTLADLDALIEACEKNEPRLPTLLCPGRDMYEHLFGEMTKEDIQSFEKQHNCIIIPPDHPNPFAPSNLPDVIDAQSQAERAVLMTDSQAATLRRFVRPRGSLRRRLFSALASHPET